MMFWKTEWEIHDGTIICQFELWFYVIKDDEERKEKSAQRKERSPTLLVISEIYTLEQRHDVSVGPTNVTLVW
jgi:hypothetical protein